MGTRQFSGLTMERQLYWANLYAKRFGGRIKLGGIADAVRVTNLPSYPDPQTKEAIRAMDDECYAEWKGVF